MLKKITLLLAPVFILLLNNGLAQQTIPLYFEDFNSGAAAFTLNSASGLGSNSGSNQWIINNSFNGNGLYPDTPDETQTVSGTITGAPFSNYLHINDANNIATAANGNYDPATASDRMAVMSTSFCTLSLTDVTFTFFYLCEGNANDYGQLYYSLDGGSSWIQTGQPQYNNTSLWKYEVVTDPAFNNQVDIRFAFRWVNNSGAVQSVSFCVDDIKAVGTYDDVNNPVTINITSVSPNPVCQGGVLIIFFELSEPMCDGTYEVEMSNATGNFSSASVLGVFNVFAGQTSGGVGVYIPSTAPPGGCYEVRINRVSPPPEITGTASICFEIQDCPNVITTLQPAVTYGPDTLCTHSVIDVPFYSTGVFNASNNYIAELSDASGSFAAPQLLGSSPDPNTYDPALGSPPGSVSGLVPPTAPGCNYYVRVRSTNPVAVGSIWGPFCIHNCDVTTNNMEDISVCITDNVGVDTVLNIDINTWLPGAVYGPTNQFQVQILSSSTYAILNTATLGSVNATSSTTLTLSIPGLLSLVPILGPPGYGLYYMRIVATDVIPSSQNYGSLVHLQIGYEDTIPPILTADDTLICAGDYLTLLFSPYHFGSQYEWHSPNLNNGTPFFWPGAGIIIGFPNNFPPGTYWFTVREYNNGCYGPWADTVYVTLITTPATGIVGPPSVCEGDTINYHVTFYSGTYYDWATTWGEIIDTSNSEITVVFDSSGVVKVSVFALNECGESNGTKTITVHPLPEITAPPDTSVCPGALVFLNATSSVTNVNWSISGGSGSTTNPTTVIAADTNAVYVVTAITSFNCDKTDTTLVNVFPPVLADAIGIDITCNTADDGFAFAIADSGLSPYSYQWNSTPVQTTDTATGLPPGTYTVIITDANGCVDSTFVTINEPPAIAVEMSSTPETFYQAHDGTATATPYGGTEPYSYAWSDDAMQDSSTAIALSSGWYVVEITDSNGCKTIDSVFVDSAPNTLGIPNAFTPNGDGLNDQFLVYNTNIVTFSCKVFNRWGQMLFFTNDVTEGWKGDYKGVPEEMGTYVYLISATYLDGNSETRKGNVTLIR
ncbi:MAG: gliding motility-associated C-terminal domain-containing protein [Chitinophagaceae bacterium]|nr:gliding motility-associated C-terminal domain-containing protein [Chitinophagaceae bacterium]